CMSIHPHSAQHVRRRKQGGGAGSDPGLAGHDLEPERPQRVREQRVLLKTVATAAPGDQRRLETVDVQPDGQTHLDVEVLERNGTHVRAVQRTKRVEVRQRGLFETEPATVAVEIEGHARDIRLGLRTCPARAWRLRTSCPWSTAAPT